uniref:Uncharacterized protein n=1 Tax=Chenopodium quinoa TaxID=63459 RepID=A0A803MT61_CHEQI
MQMVDIGFKPVGLLSVTDPQMKQLIDKCIDRQQWTFSMTHYLQSMCGWTATPANKVLSELDSRNKKFRLQGKTSEDVSISITLRIIIDGLDMVRTINFNFLLGVDTIPDVMENIQGEFDSSAEVIALVSENIEQIIQEFEHESHDSSTPSNAVEDWCLQDLFSEETSSNDAPRTHEKSNAPPSAHERANDAQD